MQCHKCITYVCVSWYVPFSPCIVADDANIDVAGQRIMWGKCINAGQSCIAPDYILCTPATQETLVEACKTAIRKFFGEVHAHDKHPPHIGIYIPYSYTPMCTVASVYLQNVNNIKAKAVHDIHT